MVLVLQAANACPAATPQAGAVRGHVQIQRTHIWCHNPLLMHSILNAQLRKKLPERTIFGLSGEGASGSTIMRLKRRRSNSECGRSAYW